MKIPLEALEEGVIPGAVEPLPLSFELRHFPGRAGDPEFHLALECNGRMAGCCTLPQKPLISVQKAPGMDAALHVACPHREDERDRQAFQVAEDAQDEGRPKQPARITKSQYRDRGASHQALELHMW